MGSRRARAIWSANSGIWIEAHTSSISRHGSQLATTPKVSIIPWRCAPIDPIGKGVRRRGKHAIDIAPDEAPVEQHV